MGEVGAGAMIGHFDPPPVGQRLEGDK
jgi:hypothetical protein